MGSLRLGKRPSLRTSLLVLVVDDGPYGEDGRVDIVVGPVVVEDALRVDGRPSRRRGRVVPPCTCVEFFRHGRNEETEPGESEFALLLGDCELGHNSIPR